MKKSITNIRTTILATAMLSLSAACTRDNTAPVIPPSEGSVLTLNGGAGESAAQNSVYVDLSADRQDSVLRSSWNLGFHGGGQFRVILNNTTGASAINAGTTDINAVNSTNVDITTLASGFSADKFAIYDDTAGRVNQTVIAEVSATDASNSVYVVNTVFAGAPSIDNIWKIRVLRSGTTGYTLQYAPLDATSFSTITVPKNDAYHYTHVSFSGGLLNAQPEKTEWDIVWGWNLYYTAFAGGFIPYGFSDLVFLNHLSGVQADVVLTADIAFADFAEANISSVTFSSDRNTIGSTWRGTTGATAGVFTDRYYIIRDVAGNIYKLRFNSMGAGSDSGVRGYPEVEYVLVRSAI